MRLRRRIEKKEKTKIGKRRKKKKLKEIERKLSIKELVSLHFSDQN